MDEMTPFLRKIAGNPADDTPRLVFADWLDENGHDKRAEFIRLQIELEHADPTGEGYPEKVARMRRCGMFTNKGKVRFFDYLPTKKCKITFRRGFIDGIDTRHAERVDTSGFDLVPLRSLRTRGKLIDKFKQFAKLGWLEYPSGEVTPEKLLEVLGAEGWFKNLEELSLPDVTKNLLEVGVIRRFDLPKLRNFFISTSTFYDLGAPDSEEDDDDYDFDAPRPWDGLPAYLPKNALPNPKSPLERFVWHSNDDCDFFGGDEDWYWRGPTMKSLLEHLNDRDLKQVEVVVDYDDHENGAEGVIAAPYEQNPLELVPTLERVTVDGAGLRRLEGEPRQLKSLRIYDYGFESSLFEQLGRPLFSGLESLHIEARGGYWGSQEAFEPGITFSAMNSLYLKWVPLGLFSNCHFPNLLSLAGYHTPPEVMEREWPTLQHLDLHVNSDEIPKLEAFARSDRCPNLTTLTVEGYFDPSKTDFSFLAECPHMPHLSLVRFPDYPMSRSYIVDQGELVPVRDDILHDGLTPQSLDRTSVVF